MHGANKKAFIAILQDAKTELKNQRGIICSPPGLGVVHHSSNDQNEIAKRIVLAHIWTFKAVSILPVLRFDPFDIIINYIVYKTHSH